MNYRNAVTWLLILVILFLAGYLVYYVNTESYKCMSNPYTYSMKLLEEANHAEIMCTCIAFKNESTFSFLYSKEGFTFSNNVQPSATNIYLKANTSEALKAYEEMF